jgi:hypothetical protein
MKESEMVNILQESAKQVIDNNLIVKTGANLYYELYFNRDLKTSVINGSNPKRGYSAFQTDLCIFEIRDNIEFPRVVFECKTNLSTHDILTYSSKAGKHKSVYPSLRYGLFVSEIGMIPGKFFIHNENIDFFIAASKFTQDKMIKLIKELIKKEVSISKKMDSIYYEDQKCNYFRTDIFFENFES